MKIWANYKVLRSGIGIPRSSVGPRQGVACPCRGVAKRRLGQALHRDKGLRRDQATVHALRFFVFCFVLLFRCSEDLSIGLIMTL